MKKILKKAVIYIMVIAMLIGSLGITQNLGLGSDTVSAASTISLTPTKISCSQDYTFRFTGDGYTGLHEKDGNELTWVETKTTDTSGAIAVNDISCGKYRCGCVIV